MWVYIRHGRTDQGRAGERDWWVEDAEGYVVRGGFATLDDAKAAVRERRDRVASIRGKLTYDDREGHVCTAHGRSVLCDRSTGTESGSFYWHCEDCGAGTWSGL